MSVGFVSRGSVLVSFVILALCFFTPASGQIPFTEEALNRGVDFPIVNGQVTTWGFGLAAVDLDGDHDIDLIFTGGDGGAIGVFENNGTGIFSDRSQDSGIPNNLNRGGVVTGDYDNDGDLDLYLVSWNTPNHLYRNDGNFSFTDVSSIANIEESGSGTGCMWGDFDNDGWLDLYVCNWTDGSGALPNPNELYRNMGNGTFEAVGDALGVANDYATFQGIFFDFDRDGDLDIYLSNGKGAGPVYRENSLWENIDGTFVDRSLTAGTAAYIDSMGLAVGDLDANGYPDLYCTNVPFGNPLFLNQSDGTFTEESVEAGVAAYRFGWGTHFLDFDNDTHLDLYVNNWGQGDLLYRNTGSYPLEDVAPAVGIDVPNLNSMCSAVADLDEDGDLDIVLYAVGQPARVFINHEGETRNWLKVRLEQQNGNLFAVGATIDVTADGVTRTRSIHAGQGYKGQNPHVQHFGLGDATSVSVSVIWPGGSVTQHFGITANQTVVLTPTGIAEPGFVRGDVNGDNSVNLADMISALNYLFIAGSMTCRAAHDIDGNGSLNLPDVVYGLLYYFSQGTPPPAPFPNCAEDPSTATLGCLDPTCP